MKSGGKMIDVTNGKGLNTVPKRTRRNTVIVLEELDWTWDEEEIKEFRQMWRKGIPMTEMVERFDRPAVEIALLMMDQEIKNRIHPRSMGLGIEKSGE